MQLTRKIALDTFYVGSSDRRLELFENIYPIERGVSYNSYLVMDEKTVLLDTVDHSVSRQFLENVRYVLDGRKLDYLIVNHVEPDHCATIDSIIREYPECRIVGNAKTLQFISQFFSFDVASKSETVKEGDVLSTGKHSFTEKEWLDDARRYYLNIVGKYGVQVMNVLKKASDIDISMICPLHGPIWRKDLGWFIDKYKTWASYEAEEEGVVIVYSSIYGNTEQAVNYLALRLSDLGVRNIHMYDASKTDCSYLLSECFRYPKAVFASVTYNLELFPKMESLLLDLKAHLYQKRKVAIVECGTWALQSGKKMTEILKSMKNIEIVNEKAVSILSSAKGDVLKELDALAEALAE